MIEPAAAVCFRNQLRDARAVALKDAEAFDEIIFTMERLGVVLTKSIEGLGKYSVLIQELACASPLAKDLAREHPGWHSAFSTLYSLVRAGRNDALHQGAFARRLTAHAVEMAVIIEDALMNEASRAKDFMAPSPVCAALWEPISSVRRAMLMNAFTFLPVAQRETGTKSWFLVSDFNIASFLRRASSCEDRKKKLAMSLEFALDNKGLESIRAPTCELDNSVSDVLELSKGNPVLVLGPSPHYDLRGIITPFDLL